MKSVRLFYGVILILSLAFLASTSLPANVQAAPRAAATGQYPEILGARCADVAYPSQALTPDAMGEAASVTPPNSQGPTLVHIGLYLDQITEVDEGSNSYKLQGFLDLIWCDPRLAFDGTESDSSAKIFLEEEASQMLTQVWSPNLEFVNEEEPAAPENLTLLIHPDGTVEYRSKVSATLASRFDLHAFPFDEQDLLVEIESFEWASDTLTFLAQDGMVGFSDEFYIPEWHVIDIGERIECKREPRDHSEFSEFMATIHVQRDPGVYVTKVMIPLGVIILISMIIFWMDPDAFEERLGASMTGLLTAVAYQFVASQNLPRHIYSTYLDAFVFLSFLVIVFGIGETVSAKYLFKNGKEQQAQWMDRTARWFMPLLYIVMIIALYLAYTR
jgi:hypothetical protein